MSMALILGGVGLVGGIAQFFALMRLAGEMRQKEPGSGPARILGTIAWVDLFALPVLVYFVGTLVE